jgi:diacylglycerol kinase (ATP)
MPGPVSWARRTRVANARWIYINPTLDFTMNRPFEFSGRISSFKHALRGIWHMLSSQHNAWIHAAATLMVSVGGFLSGLSASEWCWIILAIAAVWSAEALNTAFEFLADVTTKEFHPLVEKAKDVAAGAVLITALGATLVGSVIFGPRLAALLR